MRAELLRLAALPAVRRAALLTVAAAPLLAHVAAAAHPRAPGAHILAESLAWTQAGTVVLGALAGGAEYEGGELGTSLRARPRRHGYVARRWGALVLVTTVVALGDAVASVVALGATGRAVPPRPPCSLRSPTVCSPPGSGSRSRPWPDPRPGASSWDSSRCGRCRCCSSRGRRSCGCCRASPPVTSWPGRPPPRRR